MKKSLSLLLVLAMLVSLFAGLSVSAFAEDDEPTLDAVSTATVLTLYVQTEGEEAVPVKRYNISELSALAEFNDAGAAYVYYKKDAANAVVATQYVTLDALLADAALDFGPAQKLAFECADGPYAKGDFSYETLSARGVDAEGAAVPTALALTYAAGNLDETTIADLAAKSEFTGSFRFVSGMTAEEAEARTAAGNRLPSDVIGITIVTPEQIALEVYTQYGENEPVLAKDYTGTALKDMMETADGAAYVYYKKDAANAVVATGYVTLDALLTDAGVTFAEGDKLAFECADGPYTKGDFSYATLAARGVDAEGNTVPTALALEWEQGSLDDSTVADIAATAQISGNLRFVCGMTAEEAEAKSAAGNRMPSNVVSITVVTPEPVVLEVYTQAGKGADEVLAKAYTASELAALAETSDGATYVYYKKGAPSAYVVTEYVALDALLTDAGAAFAEGDALAFTCSDGPYTKYQATYADLGARGVDPDGSAVPTGFALSYAKGSLEDAAAAELVAKAEKSDSIQFVSGMTAEEAEAKSAAGMRMPSGVVSVTVVGQPVVQPTTQALKVDGEEKTTEVYNISDYNYFKLRDIAMLLKDTAAKFSVDFDPETRIVTVVTGEDYVPVGGELETGTDKSASCKLSAWKVEVNGEVKDIVAYHLGGNNFFKLADLGEALGFGVAYDDVTRTMLVTSN